MSYVPKFSPQSIYSFFTSFNSGFSDIRGKERVPFETPGKFESTRSRSLLVAPAKVTDIQGSIFPTTRSLSAESTMNKLAMHGYDIGSESCEKKGVYILISFHVRFTNLSFVSGHALQASVKKKIVPKLLLHLRVLNLLIQFI